MCAKRTHLRCKISLCAAANTASYGEVRPKHFIVVIRAVAETVWSVENRPELNADLRKLNLSFPCAVEPSLVEASRLAFDLGKRPLSKHAGQ